MFQNIAGNFWPEIGSISFIYVIHQLSLRFVAYKIFQKLSLLGLRKNTLCIPTRSEIWGSILEGSGSQIVLCEIPAIRDQFPGDAWIHFCNGYFEVYLFYN
jgi:hypothetical protein